MFVENGRRKGFVYDQSRLTKPMAAMKLKDAYSLEEKS